jgi:heme oxygenase-like protein
MSGLPGSLLGTEPARRAPALPPPRGPISSALFSCLKTPPGSVLAVPQAEGDPLSDDDLHLALYACYELHYRGFEGVDVTWEWQPALIEFRRALENDFERALLAEYLRPEPEPVDVSLRRIAERAGPPLSPYLRRKATIEQFTEFVVHRSAYQLKEADPHTFAIPRLDGKAKAAMVEIQFDEYGSGNAERMHSALFRKTMLALGLDGRYGGYLDRIPGVTLATVNLVTMFGLHRKWRGAATGHLALFEMTSSQPNRRYGDGLRRLGFGPEATEFYDEHVVADAVHEAIALRDLAVSLAVQEPEVADDIVFGAAACEGLEARFANYLLKCWSEGRSSLRSL